MTTYHRQCKLRRQEGDRIAFTVSWIPEEHAVVGNTVGLRNEKKEWEEGWRVITVSSRVESQYLNERSQDYKRTRKASDI